MSDPIQSGTALQPGTARTLQDLLAREQVAARLPSVVAGIVRGGDLVWSGGAGSTGVDASPGADTQYRVGSISKTFVAAAVMRAVEDSLVGLQDPVREHLPELTDGVGRVTVGQLLGQAGGVQAETDGPWWERTQGGGWDSLVPLLGESAVRARPGTRFHYSNVGFGVLGELVGRVRSSTWRTVVDEQFLQPLGMSRTTMRPQAPAARGLAVHPWADVVLPEPEHDAGAMAPAGQIWSTLTDLTRWAHVIGGGSAVLRPETITAMREVQSVDDPRGGAWTSGYGLGLQLWNVAGRRYAGHSGSMPGFVAMLRVDVETGDAVIALTNSTSGFGDLPARLLTTFAQAEPPAPTPWRPREVPAEVLELVGPWYWGPTPLVLRATTAGGLDLKGLAGRGRASEFVPVGDGTWRGLDNYYAGEVLRPVRRPDGSVSHLDLASFRLTRTPYDPAGDVPGGVDPDGWSGRG